MKSIFLFFLVLFSRNTFAFQYELRGSLGKDPKTQKEIGFSMNWSEQNGVCRGTYEDQSYIGSGILRGINGVSGRLFVITSRGLDKNIRTMILATSNLKVEKGEASVPISFTIRDAKGNPLGTKLASAKLIQGNSASKIAQLQEEPCQDGFGELAGFCGVYSGLITETSDSQNRCDLLSASKVKLVFDENGELGLVLGDVSEILQTPIHRVGRIFINPSSRRVDLLTRGCRELVGTRFDKDDCKILNIQGVFSLFQNIKHFVGKYSILDEKTTQSCTYSLTLEQKLE